MNHEVLIQMAGLIGFCIVVAWLLERFDPPRLG